VESNEQIRQQFFKMNFFKKVWYSISKFEKYPEMAALGVKRALLYYTELIIIASIMFTGIYVYYIKNVAEFDEELSFSEKIVNELTSKTQIDIEEEIVESLKDKKSEELVVSLGIASFIDLYFSTVLYVLSLSVFGIITCIFVKIKMNYKALFNMSIYSFTLSTILRIICYAITTLTTFRIKYFDIMYISIAYISLAAAIFIIKSNVIKQHLELMKIIEESKEKIEEKFPIRKKTKDEKDEKDDTDEKKDDKNDERDENNTQGQGA